MNREEHIKRAKKRAFKSMIDDLRNHPETENHAGIELGMMMLFGGHLSTSQKMIDFIEGFN